MNKRKPIYKLNPAHGISTAEGLELARFAAGEARRMNVQAALCGGLAMHLYGFTRATKDVDFIAGELLPGWPVQRKLSFGGAGYEMKLRSHAPVIPLDWIVREDDFTPIYQAALADAVETDAGFRLVTPEWLVILKLAAGRGKDEMDLLWLLRANDLVDRDEVLRLLRQHLGRAAAWPVQELESYFLEADLLRARDEQGE